MSRRNKAALAWVVLTLLIVLLNVIAPQPFGVTALGAIFEPYLVVTALLVGIAAFRAVPRSARVLVVVLIAVVLARYGPVLLSSPPPPSGQRLKVSTWNVLAGQDALARVLEGVSASDADLLALEELQPSVAPALTREATGLEFQAFAPDLGALDVGLLSRYPILDSREIAGSHALRVVVDPPMAEPFVVYVAHAPLGRLLYQGDTLVGVDLSVRDAAIAAIRQAVDDDLAQDRTVIVMGDFNMTERETEYARLSAGLRDAHLDAGIGMGHTWRPGPLSFVPVGMLRIDYVLSTANLVATSATVDCSLRSDHCRVDVALKMATPIGGRAAAALPPS